MKDLDPLEVALRGALIEASAGTGKTYTIGTLYLRLLLERGRTVPEILVVTFTNAATAELRDRIRARIRSTLDAFEHDVTSDPTERALLDAFAAGKPRDVAIQRLRAALRSFDEAAIFTIHGFCQRVLSRHAFESGQREGAELSTSDDELLDEVVRDFWVRELFAASPDEIVIVKPLGIGALTRLAKQAIASPDLRILPAEAPEPKLADARKDLDSAVEAARLAWTPIVRALLAKASGLKQTSYATKHTTKLCDELDAFFARSSWQGADVPEAFAKLGASRLRASTKGGGATPVHPFFDRADEVAREAETLAAAQSAIAVRFRHRLLSYAKDEVARRKEAARVQSFDDLLLTLDRALREPLGVRLAELIRARHPIALIDEFQDTDPLQYRIFERIYGGHDAPFLIGDPKQAIYAFRGADVFAYLAAARARSERSFTLRTNWRSDPSAISGVNAVFSRAPAPFLFDGIAFPLATPRPGANDSLTKAGRPSSGLEIVFLPRSLGADKTKEAWTAISAAIAADEVTRLLDGHAAIDGRPVSPRDIAILVRTNGEASVMQEHLRARRIPSVVDGSESVLATEDARELQILLVAVADPRPHAVRAALSTKMLGGSAERLASLDGDERAWDDVMQKVAVWRDLFGRQGLASMLRAVWEEERVPSRLLAQTSGERRVTNLLHLGELLHEIATRRRFTLGTLASWLARAREDERVARELGTDATELRLESDDDAVRIVTVHKSKGLEYGLVICPFSWSGRRAREPATVRFHDPLDDDRATLDLGSSEHLRAVAQASTEEAAESLRVLYVALTRARHRTSILWGHLPGAPLSSLAYTLHRKAEGETRDAVAARLKDADESDLLADLAALGPAVSLVDAATLAAPPAYSPAHVSSTELSAKPLARSLSTSFRTSSFSALTATHDPSARAALGRDRDLVSPPDPSPDSIAPSREEDPLRDFPAGPRTGDLLHRVLEVVDFPAADEVSLAKVAREALDEAGYDAERWTLPVARGLLRAIDTPLDREGALSLRRISREERRSELEFSLPVRPPRTGALTPAALADVFASHASAPVPASYANRLRGLQFTALEGYLRGFIDLVFSRDGRFYVVDYKSNRLGGKAADYRTSRLVAPMAQHHYILQYHLYVLALDRWLSRRVPAYHYETHFGGAYYLFLRGMSPARGASFGVYFDKPALAMVRALGALVGEVSP